MIAAEIAPCFVDDGSRTDTVVLACTHYPLILERLIKTAPWLVHWVDPAAAIARRASSLLAARAATVRLPIEAYFTSGKHPTPSLTKSLSQFGVIAAQTGMLAPPV